MNNIKTIGIDLGTTNTVVSYFDGKSFQIIPFDHSDTLPSVVHFTDGIADEVGVMAMKQLALDPQNTIYESKKLTGQSKDDIAKSGSSNYRGISKSDLDKLGYKYTYSSDKNKLQIKLGNGKTIYPSEVAVNILSKCKKVASEYLGQNIENAVITVPAYFNDIQRKETKDAAEAAGLKVERLINEPTAAALSYAHKHKEKIQKYDHLIVCDIGGGTFDVSLLDIQTEGVMQVLQTEGHLALGGGDFDSAIAVWIKSQIESKYNIDFNSMKQDELLSAKSRIHQAAEKAKKDLSSQSMSEISIPYFYKSHSIELQLMRSKFDSLINNYLKTIGEIVRSVVSSDHIKKSKTLMMITGGSAKVQSIQELCKQFGIEIATGNESFRDISYGAAISAYTLAGGGENDANSILLIDNTPLNLGIEVKGGLMATIIEKNTAIPTKASKVFSTAENNQTSVSIKVLQGDRPMADDNKSLGIFTLEGIPAAPSGVPQITVSFDIDADGILHVSAKDEKTGKENTIKVESSISDEEKEKMEQSARESKETDEKKKKNVELRNSASSESSMIQKSLDEHGDKLEDDDKNKIKSALEDLEKSLQETGLDNTNIEESLKKLRDCTAKLYEVMSAKKKDDDSTENDKDNK